MQGVSSGVAQSTDESAGVGATPLLEGGTARPVVVDAVRSKAEVVLRTKKAQLLQGPPVVGSVRVLPGRVVLEAQLLPRNEGHLPAE